MLGYHVLPAILLKYMNKVVNVYDAQKMNSDIDKLLRKHVVSLDDIGTEDTLVKMCIRDSHLPNRAMCICVVAGAILLTMARRRLINHFGRTNKNPFGLMFVLMIYAA